MENREGFGNKYFKHGGQFIGGIANFKDNYSCDYVIIL